MNNPFDENDRDAIFAALERRDRVAYAAVIARMKSIAARCTAIEGLSDVVVAPIPQTALDKIATVLLVRVMSEQEGAPRILVPQDASSPADSAPNGFP